MPQEGCGRKPPRQPFKAVAAIAEAVTPTCQSGCHSRGHCELKPPRQPFKAVAACETSACYSRSRCTSVFKRLLLLVVRILLAGADRPAFKKLQGGNRHASVLKAVAACENTVSGSLSASVLRRLPPVKILRKPPRQRFQSGCRL